MRTDRLLTAFIQDEISLVEGKLSLTLGTKLFNTNFAKFEPEPSARILWMPFKSTSIWAAYTHTVRTPADAEHDFFLSGFVGTAPDGTPFFARFNANRNFHSEQLNGYELGFRQLIYRDLFLDIATFYNHYHDLFSEDITGAPFVEDFPAPTHLLLPAQFANGLQGNTRGFEIAPQWRPVSFWRLRGSYSFLHMDIRKSPGSMDIGTAPGIEGSSPSHQITILSSLDMGKRFVLDLTYRYVSALPAQMVEAYSTGDARFGWHVSSHFQLAWSGIISFSLGIINMEAIPVDLSESSALVMLN